MNTAAIKRILFEEVQFFLPVRYLSFKSESPGVETPGLLVKALISSYFKVYSIPAFRYEQTPLVFLYRLVKN